MIYFNATKSNTQQGVMQLQVSREAMVREQGRVYPACIVLFHHDAIAEQAKTFLGDKADATAWLFSRLTEVSGRTVTLS